MQDIVTFGHSFLNLNNGGNGMSIFKFPNNSKILFMKSMNNIATGLEQNHMNKEKKRCEADS